MKAIIMAAGIGSRLKPYTDLIPKPLMPIGFKDGRLYSIIEKIIGQIKTAGIEEIIVVVSYKKELMMDYLGNGSRLGVELRYVVQDKLDGNGGAIFRCQGMIDQPVLITDADNFLEDEEVFLKLRKSFEKSGSEAVVGVKKVDDIKRYAIFKTDKDGKIIDIYEKPTDRKTWGNVAKSGFAILSERIMKMDKEVCKTNDGEYTTTQLFKYMLKNGLSISPFYFEGDYEDVGTWDSYHRILKKNI